MSRISVQRVEFVGFRGVRLRGESWGSPSAAPVLFLAGGGQTRHAWGDTAAQVAARGWRAITLDLRGHGESDWAEDADYSIESFVQDLHAVVQSLGQSPVLVGASLGGITGLLLAGERNPQAFSGLVLVDIAPRMEPDGVQRIVDFMRRHLDGFASLEEAADAVASYLPHRPRPKDLSGLEKNLRRDPSGRYRWHWDPEFVLGPKRPDASRQPKRLLAAARRLTIPTLLVRGRMSDVISYDSVREFLEAVPHARYVDVEQAGHMIAGDRNDVFSAAVIDFLDNGLQPPPRSGNTFGTDTESPRG
ncbi:MAG: alpha/beta hydrolase [Candidatus Binatia bacterium]|nr:alpha/beta hydrolase [Candidatus Binatia bacterium]